MRGRGRRPRVVLRPRARERRPPPGGPVAELLDADAEVYAALVLGTRDYVTQERLRARRARPLGRHRLDARRPRRRRRARRRARHRRDDALAATPPRARRATRARSPRTSASSCSSCRSASAMDGLRRAAGRGLRRPRARPHRGEPAGAHPRQPADGAVEQVRLARADDRQQVRDVGRLLDALRRQRRRLRGHQGRAQDARLPARGASARAATRESPIPESIVTRAPSAELRPDQRDQDSLPPYEVLDAHPRGLRRAGPRPRAARRPRPAGGRRRPRHPPRRPRRVQAPPGPAGHQGDPKAFGRDRRMPITNRYGG